MINMNDLSREELENEITRLQNGYKEIEKSIKEYKILIDSHAIMDDGIINKFEGILKNV